MMHQVRGDDLAPHLELLRHHSLHPGRVGRLHHRTHLGAEYAVLARPGE
jgi:hypothetical protein